MQVLVFLLLFLCSASSQAAIYGHDDRREVNALSFLNPISAAVAVQIPHVFLKQNSDRTFDVTDVRSVARAGMCAEEPFSEQPSLGHCTGFLIAPKVLVTAGHCHSNHGVNNSGEEYCKSFSWYFGYRLSVSGVANYTKIPESQIYGCRRVLWSENIEVFPPDPARLGEGRDFALIELDREVTFATPLPVARATPIIGENVYTIGHPWGLPAKYSGVSTVRDFVKANTITSTLDTLGGNSGGPVFNSKNQVLGILVAGHQFDTYATGTCARLNRCDENGLNCSINSTMFNLSEIQWIEPVMQKLETAPTPISIFADFPGS